jgi:hypothetical protein
MDPKHRNEPKQTEKIIYWFRETNRKSTETGRVSVCFGLNRKFLFVCFEDTLDRSNDSRHEGQNRSKSKDKSKDKSQDKSKDTYCVQKSMPLTHSY